MHINQAWIGKIMYDKDRPHFKDYARIFLFVSKNIIEMVYIIKVIFTKYEGWKHEDETRIALITNTNNALTITCFPSKIYYGVKTSNSDISSISTSISYTKLKMDKIDFKVKK